MPRQFQIYTQTFAGAVASSQDIEELTEAHWRVIQFIHGVFQEEGKCPLVFHTCKANGLRLKQLAQLFPTGYLRGACKLAGITYREGYHGYGCVPSSSRQYGRRERVHDASRETSAKSYAIDVRGFLLDPASWDETYAAMRAADMKMPPLTEAHWAILRHVRTAFEERGVVPTVYEACEAHHLEVDDLARLFPDGYHRGVVKLAGLRVL